MEEEQLKKILKNLDVNHKCLESPNETKKTCLSNVDITTKLESDLAEENRKLREELKLKDLINHYLSELYISNSRFLCEIGHDGVPNTILDSNGEVLLIVPNDSSDNILLCLYLCSFLNNSYNNIEDEAFDSFYSIQGLLHEMGV